MEYVLERIKTGTSETEDPNCTELVIPSTPNSHYLIGRDMEADLQIKDNYISEGHAIIFLKNGELLIQDAGSRNKTFVNGKKIRPGNKNKVNLTKMIEEEGNCVLRLGPQASFKVFSRSEQNHAEEIKQRIKES